MWIVFAIFSLLMISALVKLYRTHQNRPDRRLAREIRDCGKKIRNSLQEIRRIEAHLQHIDTAEYANHLRAHGWTDDDGDYSWHVNANDDAQVTRQVDYEKQIVSWKLRDESQGLKGLKEVWSVLIDRYTAQNRLFDVSPELRKQKSAKVANFRTRSIVLRQTRRAIDRACRSRFRSRCAWHPNSRR